MKYCDHKSGADPKCIIGAFKNKRQQTIAEREQELLVIAEEIMHQEGFSGLTMDKLVAACNYSKGTVYNHFNSKEDLLLALCIKGTKLYLKITKRALTFDGNSREKCLAMHFAKRIHGLSHLTLSHCILMGKNPAVQEKASSERLIQINALEREITQICDQIFVDALLDKSLSLSKGVIIENLSFATWAMSCGSNALMIGASGAKADNRLDLDLALLYNVNFLMDGMGWKPLSHQWDYKKTWQRIANEIFSKEVAAL